MCELRSRIPVPALLRMTSSRHLHRSIRPKAMAWASVLPSVVRFSNNMAATFGRRIRPMAALVLCSAFLLRKVMSDCRLNPPNVFVVDDDKQFLDSLIVLLEALEFCARGFSSPGSFLKYYRSEMPGCLVLD